MLDSGGAGFAIYDPHNRVAADTADVVIVAVRHSILCISRRDATAAQVAAAVSLVQSAGLHEMACEGFSSPAIRGIRRSYVKAMQVEH